MKKGQLLEKIRYKIIEHDDAGNVANILFFPSQAAIARHYGLSFATVNRLIRGTRRPSLRYSPPPLWAMRNNTIVPMVAAS